MVSACSGGGATDIAQGSGAGTDPSGTNAAHADGGAAGSAGAIDAGESANPVDGGKPAHDAGTGTLADAGSGHDAGGAKRVFITSQWYKGDLVSAAHAATGLAAADKICNLLAQASSVGGTWVAYLSDSSTDAIDRVPGNGPWVNVCSFGTFVAFKNRAQLQTASLGSINCDERGTDDSFYNQQWVWTGADTMGIKVADRCNDWTSSAVTTSANVGSYQGNTQWSQWGQRTCDYDLRLYCFEQ